MSTPRRFIKRLLRQPKAARREILEAKTAVVLLAVAKKFGSKAMIKKAAVDFILTIKL